MGHEGRGAAFLRPAVLIAIVGRAAVTLTAAVQPGATAKASTTHPRGMALDGADADAHAGPVQTHDA